MSVDDDRRALPPEGEPDGAGELARRPGPPAGRAIAVTATAMLAPPVIAAIAGGLGLAIGVGILSIFAGLLGFLVFVYGTEIRPRQPPAALPRARARARLRS